MMALKEQRSARQDFEKYLEIMINQNLALESSSSSGIVAIIDFSEPNTLRLDVFSLCDGHTQVTSHDNNALAAQHRLWAKYVVGNEDGVQQRRLCLERDPRQSYTVFKENHQHHQEIALDMPDAEYLEWMYQRNPLDLSVYRAARL